VQLVYGVIVASDTLLLLLHLLLAHVEVEELLHCPQGYGGQSLVQHPGREALKEAGETGGTKLHKLHKRHKRHKRYHKRHKRLKKGCKLKGIEKRSMWCHSSLLQRTTNGTNGTTNGTNGRKMAFNV
jgi:hypothetical protein